MYPLNGEAGLSTEQLLITPQALIKSHPANTGTLANITIARSQASSIIHGDDNRLLVIAGPCSIHDTEAALEYAGLLKSAAERYADDLYIIMRVYFEKPRTTVGWKGLLSDPRLDGSFDINQGLTSARRLLLDLNQLGMPAGTEFLDTITPTYFSDLITWCAIGARTVESQTHRELASSLPMPVGFKNNTDGNIKVAIDAVKVAQSSHPFLSISRIGTPILIHTTGNSSCHIILRGSYTEPNYSAHHIQEAAFALKKSQLTPRVMIDCSHGNSMKDYKRQQVVVNSIIDQLKNGSTFINGIMLESNLVAGKQKLQSNNLVRGQSITDGCIDWSDTVRLLEMLACTVRSLSPKRTLPLPSKQAYK